MEMLRSMLNKANFAKETDLKERLRKQLFQSNVIRFDPMVELDDDSLSMVNAAGDITANLAGKETQMKDILEYDKNGRPVWNSK